MTLWVVVPLWEVDMVLWKRFLIDLSLEINVVFCKKDISNAYFEFRNAFL
jgi:hypothetical protein